MNCEQFDKLSVALLYDELDELTTSDCLRHLHHCTRCQAVFTPLKETKDALAAAQSPVNPALFDQIIRLEQDARANLPITERIGRAISVLAEYTMRPQTAMAAVLLIMVAVSVLFIRSNQETARKQAAVQAETSYISPELGGKQKSVAKVYASEDMGRVVETQNQAAGEQRPTPTAPRVRVPSYREAMAAFQAGRYATAEQLFHQVSLADVEKSASAALQAAHSARNGSGCVRAVSLYRGVYRKYPRSSLGNEARWHSASCYQALGQPALAMEQLRLLGEIPAYQARAEKALAALSEKQRASPTETSGTEVGQKSTNLSPQVDLDQTPTPSSKRTTKTEPTNTP